MLKVHIIFLYVAILVIHVLNSYRISKIMLLNHVTSIYVVPIHVKPEMKDVSDVTILHSCNYTII